VAQDVFAVAAYGGIQVSEKSQDKHTPGTLDDQEERCDELAGTSSSVEELRKNKDDTIEARQWRIVNAAKPHWTIVASKTGSQDGWEPKPGIGKLQLSPPLEDLLDYKKSQFMAYASNNLDSIDDSREMTSITEAFGTPTGTFQWHDKTYSYVLVDQLPCFPADK
jgi:hypothetical protein